MPQLLNPFAQKYPEAVDGSLPTNAASVKFNPSGPFAGHYLAVGGGDGVVEVWDLETRGVVRVLEGHVKPVGGLSWSRNNRYLLSSSLDSTCILWDLSVLSHPILQPKTPIASGSTSRVRTVRFDAPIARAELHPRNSKIILATLTCNEVVLVDTRTGGGRAKLEDISVDEEMEVDGEELVEKKRAILACAVFSPCGSRIYAGSTQGELLVFDPLSRFVTHRYKVATSAIRQIAFSASGRKVILSATDRALRVLTVQPQTGLLTPTHRFQDAVNRTPWNAIGFSGAPDEEYVMGGAGHKMAHNVFIWDTDSGVLMKWHPTRPVIASVATSGDVHIWQTSSPDNWAAFAPGFEELEENVEYDEREDEFDIEDETEATRRKDAEEDFDIDVLSTTEDSFPRRPQPLLGVSRSLTAGSASNEEGEEIRATRVTVEAVRWSDAEPDEDTWEGFYLSLDLLEVEEDDGG